MASAALSLSIVITFFITFLAVFELMLSKSFSIFVERPVPKHILLLFEFSRNQADDNLDQRK